MDKKILHGFNKEQRFNHFETWRNAKYVHINNIVKKYQRRYGVSEKIAIKELRLLGFPLTDELLKKQKASVQRKQERALRRRESLARQKKEEEDEDYYYIYELLVGDDLDVDLEMDVDLNEDFLDLPF